MTSWGFIMPGKNNCMVGRFIGSWFQVVQSIMAGDAQWEGVGKFLMKAPCMHQTRKQGAGPESVVWLSPPEVYNCLDFCQLGPIFSRFHSSPNNATNWEL